ncbi:MAG: DnaJ domain-containing protein [Chloroflexi bacterium]|nr:DnaJ domain-containing protein [Chloroflexota bacterium]
MADLGCQTISPGGPHLAGTWRVAHFAAGQQAASDGRRYAPGVPAALHACYDRLELHADADAETVKLAYRRMARRYHPDLNTSPDATAQMQAINEAYERIMERLEGQQKP